MAVRNRKVRFDKTSSWVFLNQNMLDLILMHQTEYVLGIELLEIGPHQIGTVGLMAKQLVRLITVAIGQIPIERVGVRILVVAVTTRRTRRVQDGRCLVDVCRGRRFHSRRGCCRSCCDCCAYRECFWWHTHIRWRFARLALLIRWIHRNISRKGLKILHRRRRFQLTRACAQICHLIGFGIWWLISHIFNIFY